MNVNKDLLRLGILAAFIAGALLIAWLGGQLTAQTIYSSPFLESDALAENMSVTQLFQDMPLDKTVSVQGTVSKTLSDYTSKKGYQYQQFYITDGSKELMVFCSKYRGSVDVQKGDNISVTGKFQKYSSKYEIYAECMNVEVLG